MSGMPRKYYVFAGGTFNHVSPHFALAGGPAYGRTGTLIVRKLRMFLNPSDQVIILRTSMSLGFQEPTNLQKEIMRDSGVGRIETNEELDLVVKHLMQQAQTRCIVFTSAVCDFEPTSMKQQGKMRSDFGKHTDRLETKDGALHIDFVPSDKIIHQIRQDRKDIFVVGFKATAGKTEHECYVKGLNLLKSCRANLVFANDTQERHNIVVTPEEFPYPYTDRGDALTSLCEMIRDRTNLTFSRTKVVEDQLVSLDFIAGEEDAIPRNFSPVLRHLISENAFKTFRGSSSGHFGCRVLPFSHPFRRISSVRKADHNKAFEEGVVGICGEEDEVILVSGKKPSVGEVTQKAIYEKWGDSVHSIIHVHCPLKEGSLIPVAPQRPFECGSHQCADNTVEHMKEMVRGIHAVHLDGHGPNIAFHKDVLASDVIRFIDDNVELGTKIGGEVS